MPARSAYLTLSPEARRILDVTTEDTVSLWDAIRAHADHDQELIRDSLDGLFRRAETFEIEVAGHTSTGRALTVRLRGEPVFDDDGVVVSAHGAVWDVTEAVTELERRIAIERRLDDTLNAFGDGLVFLDKQGRMSSVNAKAAVMTGIPVEQMVGASIWDLFAEWEGSAFETAFRRAIDEGVRTQAREYSTRSGIWLDCTLHPTRGGLVLYTRDATEDERMRRATTEAQRRVAEQAALLDAARDAVIVRSLDGIVEYCNAAAARLYGWTIEEAVGRDIREVVSGRPHDFDTAATATLRDGYWAGELHERTRDGRAIIVDSRWQLLQDDAGKPSCVLSLGSDITRWRQVEQERIHARRLESLGTLAGGIAHDLNNVLTPILLAVQLLKRGEQDEADLQLLATMETAARRGADMVGQVLAFARGIDGRRERIAIDPLFEELRTTARTMLPASVALEVDVAPDVPDTVGDSTQLLQVLANLVTNARDAMPQGGSLGIRASAVNLCGDALAHTHLDLPGRYVRIDVDDTGTGMSEEVAEKVFEPFFTTKPLGRGTGLGLATSLSIVRSHGGSIRVDSEPGRGTRVAVLLPVADGSEGAVDEGADSTASAPLGDGELVLVIDDDASIRVAVPQALQAYGYQVLTASNGEEGIALIESGGTAVDVVLTDMMMPVMDGAAMSAYLKEHHPGIPVIASSGLVTRADETDGPRMGVAAFLPKPYTTGALLTVLRNVLDDRHPEPGAPVASTTSGRETA